MLFHLIFCMYSPVQKKVFIDKTTRIHFFKTMVFAFFSVASGVEMYAV